MSAKMIKLTMAYGGRPVFINPLLLSAIFTPPEDDIPEVVTGAGILNPKIGALVATVGDMEGVAVSESPEEVMAKWEEVMNA